MRPCKVGSYPPNKLGLHDMHGNVWEWCDDEYKVDQGAAQRIGRSGGWSLDASLCRAAHRGPNAPSGRNNVLGLRVARVPVGKQIVKIISLPELPTGEAVDLLAKIEIPRDALKSESYGEWTREGKSLVSPPPGKAGRIIVRHQPPPEYELTAVVERVTGTDGVLFGVVVDDHAASVGLDTYTPRICSIALIDKKWGNDNESTVKRAVLTERKPYTIRITVCKRSIKATVDNQQVLYWEGDPARLSCGDGLDDQRNVWFGSGFDQFRFHKLELRPLKSSATFKNSLRMEFVLVPKGKSWLGGGNGKPGDTKVEIKEGFYLGTYEVTQEEWEKVMGPGANLSWFARCRSIPCRVKSLISR